MTTSFEAVAARMLSTLRQDLRDFFHVVCDDGDLDEELRSLAFGAVLYGLTPGDLIPDSVNPPLGYIDDALAIRVVLEKIARDAPRTFARYRERLPELCDALDGDIAAARDFLGDVYDSFVARVFHATSLTYKGKSARDAFDDSSFIDEELTVLSVKLAFKEEAVQSAARRVHTLLPQLREKLTRR